MVRYLLLFVSCVLTAYSAFSQTGDVQGRVFDKSTNEGLPFAGVTLKKGATIISATQTDFDGKYSFKVAPGTYDVQVEFASYETAVTQGITVSLDRPTFVDVEMNTSRAVVPPVIVRIYKKPLINPGLEGSQTMIREEIDKAPVTSVGALVNTQAGASTNESNGEINLKGSRGDATQIIIDGIKVSGSRAISNRAIEQMDVLTGGIPAKYGDATGGIINITTRGGSSTFQGGAEFRSSNIFDAYNSNLANFNLSGPILFKHKNDKDLKRTFLDFFVNLELASHRDPDPSAVQLYKVKDEVLDSLEQQPLRKGPIGGYQRSAEYVTFDDLEEIKYRPNVKQKNILLSTKSNVILTESSNITFGGSASYYDYNSPIYEYGLFNFENNPQVKDLDWRTFIRFTQRFTRDKDTSSAANRSMFHNAQYSLQMDYSKGKDLTQDENHEDRYFDYGYVGRFERIRTPFYINGTDTTTGLEGPLLQSYDFDREVKFTAGDVNPLMANYTSEYYRLSRTPPRSFTDLSTAGALINGERPGNVYSTWYNTGRQYNGYAKNNNDQFRLTGNGSIEIRKPGKSARNTHSVEFGFEYEQRTNRSYSVSPMGLWTLGRQYTNFHINELDKSNPVLVIDGQEYTYAEYLADPALVFDPMRDVINYPRIVNKDDQYVFDQRLREKIGAAEDDYILFDTIAPSTLSLDMFTPDELFNNSSNLVSYYGFDYLGNKLSTQPSFNDFFTEKDEDGNFTRPIAAYRPIYVSGYLMDRFYFRDLIFNVGLRVDRFDANQKVLKDPYSLYDVYTKGETDPSTFGPDYQFPTTIGDDYVVYVDDPTNPERVVGFRSGDPNSGGAWYNAEGVEITDPTPLAQASSTGKISPYLVDGSADVKSENFDAETSFKDYDPQVSIMPRVAFSFPITEVASFFAHYDKYVQRPQGTRVIRSSPYDYYFFEEIATDYVFPNPGLKPEKTIDYEIGFQQKLSEVSSITISGFYKEIKDQVQVVKNAFAFPTDYRTFGNVDFGTVKGMIIGYDLRRVRNIRMGANYTLQFAEGTGSDNTSQFNLVSGGQPNLRAIFPLNYDQRHAIKVNIDYRYRSGENYDGPEKLRKVLQGAGANFIMIAGSGTPYTQHANPTPTAQFGISSRSTMKGSVNGARLPWTVRIDGRLDKDFEIKSRKSEEGAGRNYAVNVYLQGQNLLNSKNILSVYSYTGNPDDDGYLTSPIGRDAVAGQTNPESFEDLYRISANRPGNYTNPRRLYLGAIFNF